LCEIAVRGWELYDRKAIQGGQVCMTNSLNSQWHKAVRKVYIAFYFLTPKIRSKSDIHAAACKCGKCDHSRTQIDPAEYLTGLNK